MIKAEKEIKKLLGIPEEENLVDLYTYKKKGKTYYYFETYNPSLKAKKFYHVPRKLESEILKLNEERKRAKRKIEEISKAIVEVFGRFPTAEEIEKVLKNIYEEQFKKQTKDYAYEKYKQKALELFEELKPYLLELKKNKLNRISLLQALYILVNVREMFKEKGEEELLKAIRRAVSTIILRDKNQKLQNPFGVLKSDFFLPQKTPYDFLLSSFLQSELEPIFEKLLLAQLEKQGTQEVMAKISEFLASLSDRAKQRILKVFPSFSEFSKALFESWKSSGENLEEFLKEWKEYLELETQEKEEETEIVRFLEELKR